MTGWRAKLFVGLLLVAAVVAYTMIPHVIWAYDKENNDYALSFDGVDDYAVVADSYFLPLFLDIGTMELKIRFLAPDASDGIVSRGTTANGDTDMLLYYYGATTGNLRLLFRDTASAQLYVEWDIEAAMDGEWHLFQFSWNTAAPSYIVCWMDGEQLDEAASSKGNPVLSNDPSWPDNLVLGCQYWNGGMAGFFTGEIDDFEIYADATYTAVFPLDYGAASVSADAGYNDFRMSNLLLTGAVWCEGDEWVEPETLAQEFPWWMIGLLGLTVGGVYVSKSLMAAIVCLIVSVVAFSWLSSAATVTAEWGAAAFCIVCGCFAVLSVVWRSKGAIA